jgi:hypothetical protein
MAFLWRQDILLLSLEYVSYYCLKAICQGGDHYIADTFR